MMSNQRPNLWRVLSETSRIINSNSLHFLALSLLFIFPIPLFNIIHTFLLQPSPLINSHYRRLLSTVSDPDPVSQIPSFDKTLTLTQFLYGLILLIFNLCAVSSVTHSIFHGFHSTPLKFTTSLKSILSSFLPLLATKLVYFVIVAAAVFGFGICMALAFLGLMFLGFTIEATSKPVMAVAFISIIIFLAMLVYLAVKWYVMDAVVVVESKYGFAPFERSSRLVEGSGRVAFALVMLFAFLHVMLSGWFSAVAGGVRGSGGGCSVGVALQLLAYAGFSTLLSVFGLAAETVFFVHCRELNGETEFQSDEKKLGQVYVPVPHEVVDEV